MTEDEQIKAAVVSTDYVVSGVYVRCTLTMTNGFSIFGESQAPSEGDFKESRGKKAARADALAKLMRRPGSALA